jgi:ketosteroid isomerase-like protein
MSNENAELIRRAYQAYANGDLAAMLELVDPDLEWTYLDPALEHPTPQVCHGRHELEQVLRHWAEHGRRVELEEVISSGELVMVGVRTPGSMPITVGAGATAPTACSRCARGGWLPCATAAIGRRPCAWPPSSRNHPH